MNVGYLPDYYQINYSKSSQMNKALSLRRKEKDIFKLRSANYEVTQTEQASTYHVSFLGWQYFNAGPKNTPY